MAGPDPNQVKRQPMARAGGRLAITRGAEHSRPPARLYGEDDRLDLATLHALFEDAEAMAEGQVYAGAATGTAAVEGRGRSFMGSVLITIDLGRATLLDPVGPDLARRLRGSLEADARAGGLIRARAAREAARLLGSRTPARFESSVATRCKGLRVLIDVDLEANLDEPE